VALVEVLRSGPAVVESHWSDLAEVAGELVVRGDVRPGVIDEQVRDEHHVAMRERWSELIAATPALSKAMA